MMSVSVSGIIQRLLVSVTLLLVLGCTTYSEESSMYDHVVGKRVTDTIADWNELLARQYSIGTPLAELESLIGEYARDKGVFYSGGTGIRRVSYLIDDFVQIDVTVDRMGRILEPPIAIERLQWIRNPDGSLRL